MDSQENIEDTPDGKSATQSHGSRNSSGTGVNQSSSEPFPVYDESSVSDPDIAARLALKKPPYEIPNEILQPAIGLLTAGTHDVKPAEFKGVKDIKNVRNPDDLPTRVVSRSSGVHKQDKDARMGPAAQKQGKRKTKSKPARFGTTEDENGDHHGTSATKRGTGPAPRSLSTESSSSHKEISGATENESAQAHIGVADGLDGTQRVAAFETSKHSKGQLTDNSRMRKNHRGSPTQLNSVKSGPQPANKDKLTNTPARRKTRGSQAGSEQTQTSLEEVEMTPAMRLSKVHEAYETAQRMRCEAENLRKSSGLRLSSFEKEFPTLGGTSSARTDSKAPQWAPSMAKTTGSPWSRGSPFSGTQSPDMETSQTTAGDQIVSTASDIRGAQMVEYDGVSKMTDASPVSQDSSTITGQPSHGNRQMRHNAQHKKEGELKTGKNQQQEAEKQEQGKVAWRTEQIKRGIAELVQRDGLHVSSGSRKSLASQFDSNNIDSVAEQVRSTPPSQESPPGEEMPGQTRKLLGSGSGTPAQPNPISSRSAAFPPLPKSARPPSESEPSAPRQLDGPHPRSWAETLRKGTSPGRQPDTPVSQRPRMTSVSSRTPSSRPDGGRESLRSFLPSTSRSGSARSRKSLGAFLDSNRDNANTNQSFTDTNRHGDSEDTTNHKGHEQTSGDDGVCEADPNIMQPTGSAKMTEASNNHGSIASFRSSPERSTVASGHVVSGSANLSSQPYEVVDDVKGSNSLSARVDVDPLIDSQNIPSATNIPPPTILPVVPSSTTQRRHGLNGEAPSFSPGEIVPQPPSTVPARSFILIELGGWDVGFTPGSRNGPLMWSWTITGNGMSMYIGWSPCSRYYVDEKATYIWVVCPVCSPNDSHIS